MFHGLELLEQQEASISLAPVASQKRHRHAQARDRRKILVQGESFEAVRLDAVRQFELNHTYDLTHHGSLPLHSPQTSPTPDRGTCADNAPNPESLATRRPPPRGQASWSANKFTVVTVSLAAARGLVAVAFAWELSR
jgi:hypothetical protein